MWIHVDGAYGGAALLAPSASAPLFDGIERADSFIVDPHKWLFAPFDACALLYRDPAIGARAPTCRRPRTSTRSMRRAEWNAGDYAYHLTRRARGLPLWFSLATYGTDAYRDAVEAVLALTREAADEIRRHPELELIMEPELSVVLFRRAGWSSDDYERLVAAGARCPGRVRPADLMGGREGRAPVLREPEHHDRARPGDPRNDGVNPTLAADRRAAAELQGDRVQPLDPLAVGRVGREEAASSRREPRRAGS